MGNIARTMAGLESLGNRHHVVNRCGRASDVKVDIQ
jgi:hypothetical protein